jgi:hypothetical protein
MTALERKNIMATPKGTRTPRSPLKSGDALHIYSDAQVITLQLRREVPTEADVAATSFKASVVLTPAEALAVALLPYPSRPARR